jgi:hypothetical protein
MLVSSAPTCTDYGSKPIEPMSLILSCFPFTNASNERHTTPRRKEEVVQDVYLALASIYAARAVKETNDDKAEELRSMALDCIQGAAYRTR